MTEFAETLNDWGARGIPFLFVVDFEMKKPVAYALNEVDSQKILYDINGHRNYIPVPAETAPVGFIKFPIPYEDYKKKYDQVRSRLAYGDSYLTNLTIKTQVRSELPLRDIFFISRAKYKLLFDDEFLVFSPETFVHIADGRILAHPMKGTIDASFPDARNKILADPKEMAEHVTIVDLIRNDLSAVANNVQVTRFRYVDEIRTIHKNLLQVSSEISGDLPADYHRHLGDLILKLLPAGSVSGAPKQKTLQIIRTAEKEPRGYYTGVVGIFDGNVLDSGVMIRFLQREGKDLYYRSGGGITVQSTAESEYQEAIDKVYVPLN
jgi:para-aminobenzoate synthetase component I